MGNSDKIIFIKTKYNDMFLCNYNVDDIIFGATDISLCEEFTKSMDSEFNIRMSTTSLVFKMSTSSSTKESIFKIYSRGLGWRM